MTPAADLGDVKARGTLRALAVVLNQEKYFGQSAVEILRKARSEAAAPTP